MKPKKLAEICIAKFKTLFPDADSISCTVTMEYKYGGQYLYGAHLMAHYHDWLLYSGIEIGSDDYHEIQETRSFFVREVKSIKDLIRKVDEHVLKLGRDNHIDFE